MSKVYRPTRISYETILDLFDKSNLNLLTTELEYEDKNTHSKLDYTCRKHLERGVQHVSYGRLKSRFKKGFLGCPYCTKSKNNANVVSTDVISGIYKIENTENHKIYIGQSNNIYGRWYDHQNDLNTNKHHNAHLQRAWNKYGEDKFDFSILEICDISLLNEREMFWINTTKSYNRTNGYNLTVGGEGGRSLEQDVVEKIYSLYNNDYTPTEISDELNVNIRTVHKYLKQGTLQGLCQYDVYKDKLKSVGKKIVCLNTNKIYKSIKEAEDENGIRGLYACPMHIVDYCGKDKDGNPLFWLYYDEYKEMSDLELQEYVDNLKLKYDYRVICLNNGIIYSDCKEASKVAGLKTKQSIAACCNGHRKCGGKNKDTNENYVWAYYRDYVKMSAEDVRDKLLNGQITYQERKIICLNTLETFHGVKFAVKKYPELSADSIKSCCRGASKTSGVLNGEKLVWMFYDDYLKLDNVEEYIKIKQNAGKVSVICTTTNMKFNSVKEGADYYGMAANAISECCSNKRKYIICKQLDGMRLNWMYYEDYLKLNKNNNDEELAS